MLINAAIAYLAVCSISHVWIACRWSGTAGFRFGHIACGVVAGVCAYSLLVQP